MMDEIIAVIGIEAALKLCSAFAGNSIYIPIKSALQTKNLIDAMRADYENGLSINTLSTKYRLSNRRIKEILRKK